MSLNKREGTRLIRAAMLYAELSTAARREKPGEGFLDILYFLLLLGQLLLKLVHTNVISLCHASFVYVIVCMCVCLCLCVCVCVCVFVCVMISMGYQCQAVGLPCWSQSPSSGRTVLFPGLWRIWHWDTVLVCLGRDSGSMECRCSVSVCVSQLKH